MWRKLVGGAIAGTVLMTLAVPATAGADGATVDNWSYGPECETGIFLGVEGATRCVTAEGVNVMNESGSGQLLARSSSTSRTVITDPDGVVIYSNPVEVFSVWRYNTSTEEFSSVQRSAQTAQEFDVVCEVTSFEVYVKGQQKLFDFAASCT